MTDIPGLPYDAVTDVEDLSGNGKGVALNVWPSDNRVPRANDPVPLDTMVLDQGELAYALDSERLRVGDGYTPGGDEVAYMSDFYELRDEFIIIRDALMEAMNDKANLDGGNNFTGDQNIDGELSISYYGNTKLDGENIYMDATDAYPTIFYTTNNHLTQVGALYGPTVGDPMMYLQSDTFSFGSGDESQTYMAIGPAEIETVVPLRVRGAVTIDQPFGGSINLDYAGVNKAIILADNNMGLLALAPSFSVLDYDTETINATIDATGINIPAGRTYKINGVPIGSGGGGGGLIDGDYGDVLVGGVGTTMTVQTVGGAPIATVSQLANYLPLTGGTLTGPLTVKGAITASSATAGQGSIDLQPGTASNSGYVSFYVAGGARAGFLGNAPTGSGIQFVAEGGRHIEITASTLYTSGPITATGSITTQGANAAMNVTARDSTANFLLYANADTLNFYSGAAVRASLTSTGKFSAAGVNANKNSNADITTRNPGLLVYEGSSSYGLELGYSGSNYATRLFTGSDQIILCNLAADGTLQSHFTDYAKFGPTGLVLTGGITATGKITGTGGLQTGNDFIMNALGNNIIYSRQGLPTYIYSSIGSHNFLNSGSLEKVVFNCDTGYFDFTGNAIRLNGSPLATVSQLANYLPLTGGVLSGALTINASLSVNTSTIWFGPQSGEPADLVTNLYSSNYYIFDEFFISAGGASTKRARRIITAQGFNHDAPSHKLRSLDGLTEFGVFDNTGLHVTSDIFFTNQLYGGIANLQTPNVGSTGALRIKGNPTSGYGILQAVSPDGTAEWSHLTWDNTGLLHHTGRFVAAGGIESGTTQSIASTAALVVASSDRIATVHSLAVAMSISLQPGLTDGQRTVIMIKDNGVQRVLTWLAGLAQVRAANVTGVSGATIVNKWLIYQLIWNTAANCWFILDENKEI